jgi:inosine/xanthosine triphosphate pyrophosphatase family protein
MFYELLIDYICKPKISIMQLVFASNNKNKIKEIQLLVPQYIHVLSLEDIGCLEEIPETALDPKAFN